MIVPFVAALCEGEARESPAGRGPAASAFCDAGWWAMVISLNNKTRLHKALYHPDIKCMPSRGHYGPDRSGLLL